MRNAEELSTTTAPAATAMGLNFLLSVPEADAGAMWNYLLAEEDRSMGVHNAKYIMGLLDSSIQYLEGKKAVAPVAMIDQD